MDIYIKKYIMKKIVRLTESDLVRLVKRVISEQNDSASLSKGLKMVVNNASLDLNGLKTICNFCKGRADLKQQTNTGQLITKVNKLLSGIENPVNLMGGGSVSNVAELINKEVKTPEEVCALIKFYYNQKSLVGLSFGGDDEDFYEAISDDLTTKVNTTEPLRRLITSIGSKVGAQPK